LLDSWPRYEVGLGGHTLRASTSAPAPQHSFGPPRSENIVATLDSEGVWATNAAQRASLAIEARELLPVHS
jgi:hypothetical protein